MLDTLFRKPRAEQPALPAAAAASSAAAADDIIERLARHASDLGREAAEVRGTLDDTHKLAAAQARDLQALAAQLQEVIGAQAAIGEHAQAGVAAVGQARAAVDAVGDEVGAIVQTLRQVADAAGQITKIALQTRLVAFNASVEAKRAGEAGRGFGVVADAVKDLAAQVEASSKQIMGTVSQLDGRIDTLAREIRAGAGTPGGSAADGEGAVHRSLGEVEKQAARIAGAAQSSREVCGALQQRLGGIEQETAVSTRALDGAMTRSESFLRVSEQLIEMVAASGLQTEDTPFIAAAQDTAARIGALFEAAVRNGDVSAADLFDERYQPIAGTQPQQHMARFTALLDRLLPPVQEPVLETSDRVVFCIAADRNGYVATHNKRYCQPQRGDLAWDTANSRYRRIFDDRTGLASARNRRPFLLQTYRRDMGGGKFVVMKEVAAPIVVDGRHWGGLRLAYRFA